MLHLVAAIDRARIMPEEERYIGEDEIGRHGDINTYMAQGIIYGNTELGITGCWYIRKCPVCKMPNYRYEARSNKKPYVAETQFTPAWMGHMPILPVNVLTYGESQTTF